ncbi:nuclear transport factor 2 family protein [Salininema proteolyticum]|uniref:DUF4440 domain-containing protein n=1 Tax=Salininema proteolyticum TaxID=1607685 RepID=A0ABV8U5S3_9ACTN
MPEAETEIDELMRRFLGAFTNTGGARPDVEAIRDVFLPDGTIISNVGGDPKTYDLDSFIEPRERILTDGTLTEFSEWEVSERTEIYGGIAQRFSHYAKSGALRGEWFEGEGRKSTQFVKTPDGWRINSMIWDDA